MIGQLPVCRATNEPDPADWWGTTDGEILDCLRARGPVSVSELCAELGFSEGAATSFLALLAREGRVRIREVELAS